MTTLAAARSWFEAQVGTVEGGGADGHSGNIIHYWDDIGHHSNQGLSWCGALCDAGAKATKLALPGSMVDTTQGALAFHKAGLWHPVGEGGKPGDFVFYAWNGKKDWESIDHIGFLITMNSASSLTDVEGNTSGVGDSGQSQRNGGMVAKRVRSTRFVVGYGRPKYAAAPAPRKVLSANPYNHNDSLVKWTQWALGVAIDGNAGPVTQKALAEFRRRQGIRPLVGGYPDPKTIAALSQVKRWKTV